MATEVKAFLCDFCTRKRKRFASKSGAVRHEQMCFYNPIRQACATCKHFTFDNYYSEPDTGYSEGGPRCDKDALNTVPGESELRVECELWELRSSS